MRLTRHAKNRLRYMRRRAPEITEAAILDVLPSGSELGSDVRGNRLLAVRIEGILLTVIVDDARQA